MKYFMKNKLFLAIIGSFTLFGNINSATATTQQLLQSTTGYPYKNLLNKSDIVKIIYSEGEDHVECNVELALDDLQLKSQKRTTAKDKFAQAPLASCLQRKQAKLWLKTLYNQS